MMCATWLDGPNEINWSQRLIPKLDADGRWAWQLGESAIGRQVLVSISVYMVLEGSTSPITALECKSSLWRRNNSFSFFRHVGDYAERRRLCPGRFNRAEFPLSRHPL
jgi:hypothetical protein